MKSFEPVQGSFGKCKNTNCLLPVSQGRCKTVLFEIPGVTALTVCLDYCHTKYLGSDQYQFGSVLALLVHHVMPNTPQNNLGTCWRFIKKFYKDNDTEYRYQYLNKLTMFMRKKGYPKLRGKAAEIKCLGPALLALWTGFMNPALSVHKQVKLMLKCNVQMEQILSDHKDRIALPAGPAKQFKDVAFVMAQAQNAVAQHFLGDENLFNVTSKTHAVLHSALLAKFISPRRVWCFRGESYMRHAQKMAKSCVRRLKGPAVVVKMAAHMRLAMDMRFRKQF